MKDGYCKMRHNFVAWIHNTGSGSERAPEGGEGEGRRGLTSGREEQARRNVHEDVQGCDASLEGGQLQDEVARNKEGANAQRKRDEASSTAAISCHGASDVVVVGSKRLAPASRRHMTRRDLRACETACRRDRSCGECRRRARRRLVATGCCCLERQLGQDSKFLQVAAEAPTTTYNCRSLSHFRSSSHCRSSRTIGCCCYCCCSTAPVSRSAPRPVGPSAAGRTAPLRRPES